MATSSLRSPDPADPPVQGVDFGGITIAWDERVLRPRAWTLEQSLWAAELLESLPAGPVLELCSGAGHIGLRAVLGSGRQLVCVDANPVAAAYTLRNARAAGLADQVTVRAGWMDEVFEAAERFAMVIADPPWVPSSETGQFPEDPLLAIDGGADGLHGVRACLSVIERHLATDGIALLQLGNRDQADVVSGLAHSLDPVEVRSFEAGVVLRLDRSG